MYLIVGLGNPGKEYEKTRHNMGFDFIDKLSAKYGIDISKQKFDGLYGSGLIEGEKVILLKPQTYMNLSGKSVEKFASFYKIDEQKIIVVYDDIDVQPGYIRIRKQGSAGTHNGMKSVISELGSDKFPRIRIGTGSREKIFDLVRYVLENVKDHEFDELMQGVDTAVEATVETIKHGIDISMNKFN